MRKEQKPVRELELILAIHCANTPVRADARLKFSGIERVKTRVYEFLIKYEIAPTYHRTVRYSRAPARFRWNAIYAGDTRLANNLNVGGDPQT